MSEGLGIGGGTLVIVSGVKCVCVCVYARPVCIKRVLLFVNLISSKGN